MSNSEPSQTSDPSKSTTTSRTFLVGLSGPSSSGKTTLARLLRQIFNSTNSPDSSKSVATSDKESGDGASTASSRIRLFILHEDDFYKTDTEIPVREITSSEHGTRNLQDWDCVESLDLPILKSTLQHIKRHGGLPPDMFSKEDQNTVGESGVSDDVVQEYQKDVAKWMASNTSVSGEGAQSPTVICLFDGFLLYPDPDSKEGSLEYELHETLRGVLDAKLFISGTRELTIERRSKRTGYVTLEGFWADPPGYVEDVVWPNYRRDHAWLFRKGEEDDEETREAVDHGRVNRSTATKQRILVGPGDGDVHLKEILPWAIERLKEIVDGGKT